MPVNFLYPDPTRDKVMEELNKLVEILERPKNPQTVKNVRILRNFTKALFLVSHGKGIKKQETKKDYQTIKQESYPKPTEESYQKPIKAPQPRKLIQPPLPPPPPSPVKAPSTSLSTKEPELKENTISQLKEENGELKYDLVEPTLQDQDWKIYNLLEPIVREAVRKDPNLLERPNFIEDEIAKIAKQLKIKYSLDYVKKLKYHLTRNLKGFGKIDPLIKDSRVKKIICESFDNIKVIFNNKLIPTNIQFDSNQELNNFVLNIGKKYGKIPTETTPNIAIKIQNLEVKANYAPLMGSSFTITKL
ncbi:MAG: hypothetical protein KKG75_02130 [Nanoarchaeota archaeon]|nr:hypothetical protein [Nanoarchaeota archaeon]